MRHTLEQLQALSDEELIEKVAVEVMGWQTDVRAGGLNQGSLTFVKQSGESIYRSSWDPLNDWNHTMEVWEECREKHHYLRLQDDRHGHYSNNGGWFIEVLWDDGHHMIADREFSHQHPQRAICLAALLAVAA